MFPLTPDQHHWLEVATEDEGWCSLSLWGWIKKYKINTKALHWLWRSTCDQQVTGSTLGRSTFMQRQMQYYGTWPWASCSHTCASVTKQYNLVLGQRVVLLSDWEGNRRSGIALAMRHRLSGVATYGLNVLGKGDEHPSYDPVEYYRTFTFTFNAMQIIQKRTKPLHINFKQLTAMSNLQNAVYISTQENWNLTQLFH